MPFNGNGVFTRIYSWINDKNAGIKIRADRMDNEMNGMAKGLSTCITKDGQTTVIANLPMAGYRHTGVGDATSTDQYATLGQTQQIIQNDVINWAIAGGTADAITATYDPFVTTLVNGQLFYVRAGFANATTTPTFSPDGLTARPIVKNGNQPLDVADIAGAGQELILRYNSTNTKYELLNPAASANFDKDVFFRKKVATPVSATLTIASDVITVTGAYHLIDTEGAAATDNLVTINGGADGQVLVLRTVDDARDVTIKTTGNISSGGVNDIVLSNSNDLIVLKYDAAKSKWLVQGATAAQGALADTAAQRGGTTGQILKSTGPTTAPVWANAFDYVSPNQTWAVSGSVVVAHGLGVVPSEVQAYLVCITSQDVFLAGDITPIGYGLSMFNGAANVVQSLYMRADATNIAMGISANGFMRAGVALTPANFRIVFKARK